MSEAAMHSTGIVFGWVIVIGYVLAVMKYFVRLIHRKVIISMPQDSRLRKKYIAFMRSIVTVHPYIGLYLLTFIVLHSLIELVHKGFFITGLILAGLMILQIFLGAYGTFVKGRRKGLWFDAHRTLAALLSGAIAIHILAVIFLHRGSNPGN